MVAVVSILLTGLVVGSLATSSAPAASARSLVPDKDWIEQELAHATFNIYANSPFARVMPGMVPGPYCTLASPYFWAAMLDYSHYSGDSIFDSRIVDSLWYQAGLHGDFMPLERFDYTTHDDLALWAWVAMSAAERKFLEKDIPQIAWFQLIDAPLRFLRDQWNRPENSALGGLRYIHRWEPYGDHLLYSGVNCYFFALLARMARFSGTEGYQAWAERVWSWMDAVDLISDEHAVWHSLNSSMTLEPGDAYFDKGTSTETHAVLLVGEAYMYNLTNGDDKWKSRAMTTWYKIRDISFNHAGIIRESCEKPDRGCRLLDVLTKSQTVSHFALAIKVAPFLEPLLLPHIKATADAAARTCRDDGVLKCKPSWIGSAYDDEEDELVNNVAALNAIMATHVLDSPAPLRLDEQFKNKGPINVRIHRDIKI